MLINSGRLLMIFLWAFLLLNLVHPFPKPLRYFVNVALLFMVIMHGLQLVLMRATHPKQGPKISGITQIRIFFFGVFELLAWQKKYQQKS
ncbi:DUF1145 family protein [Erwinia endophytica]|uniref:DUF1145 family protein n=1 Tax=Erwinia endophytica TaxID=1563158 RepID=UPI001265F82C|nr:DUF1145 family protein [Erwinia endophytica]KAB8312429.1 DUF1145 family protein [Erwinia endophytica]